MVTQSQQLNLQAGYAVQPVVHVSLGDSGTTIELYLYNQSEPFYPSGYEVTVHGLRQDNVGFGPITVSTTSGSNKVTFKTTSAMTGCAGAALAELNITNGSLSLGTANFAIMVENATFPNSVTYSNDLSVYQQILAYVSKLPGIFNGKLASLQAQIDELTSLEDGSTTGDAELTNIRVAFDGVTYSTAGSAVRDQAETLYNRLIDTRNLFTAEYMEMTESSSAGYYWSYTTGELVSDSNYTAWRFTAEPLTDYVLQGLIVGTSTKGAVLFLDSNGNILSCIYTGTQQSGHKFAITTPLKCVTVKYSTYTNATWDTAATRVDRIADKWGYLPDYYFSSGYLDGKITAINDAAALHGISFAFFTDIHVESNSLYSCALLQYIRKHTAVNTIICGGDFPASYGDQTNIDYAKGIALQYAKTLYPDYLCLRGNHDFTIKTDANTADGITENDAKTYHAIVRASAPWRYEVPTPEIAFVDSADAIYANYNWVLTNEQEKIKIIGFCDFNTTDTSTYWGVRSYFDNEYCAYLAQMLKSCDGYSIIVVSHAPLLTSMTSGTGSSRIQSILAAFVARSTVSYGYEMDFSSCTGTLICCLSGHAHIDQTATVDGVLHIGTTCDTCYQRDGYGRARGTVSEQAIDVVSIDTDARTITMTRIGGGSDRSFNY